MCWIWILLARSDHWMKYETLLYLYEMLKTVFTNKFTFSSGRPFKISVFNFIWKCSKTKIRSNQNKIIWRVFSRKDLFIINLMIWVHFRNWKDRKIRKMWKLAHDLKIKEQGVCLYEKSVCIYQIYFKFHIKEFP